jgi:glyoxylase-like metal-dependent hydrolase (beta-lactamase superfamily II)
MGLRRLIVPALAAAAVLGVGATAWSAIVPAPPAIAAFKLGALDVAVARDADIAEPNDAKVFGLTVGPGPVARVLSAAGAPDNVITMSIDVLVVRLPGHVVLLDSGIGPSGHGVLLASLAKLGVSAQDVTDVFITHGHHDHTGGLVDADGKPTFAKATIRMSEREWAAIQADPRAKAQMAPVASRVETFEPGRPVLPGITPVALYGHTPGHTGYSITSEGKTLLDIGDVAHSAIVSLAKPGWAEGYDFDKVAGAAARLAILKPLADERTLIFVPHFPFPGVGRIEASGDAFAWRPLTPLAP